jgi:hypothetical protein
VFQPPPRPGWQYYLNPWWTEEHVFLTRLSKEESRRRLNESTTRWLGKSVARSLVSLADFTLHRVTFYNNGFKPFAYLRVDDSTPPDTTVRVTFSASNSVRVFFVVWYAFLALFAAGIVVSTVGRQPTSAVALPLAVVAALIAWPILLTWFGRAIAHGDRRYLTDFIVETLELTTAQRIPAANTQWL